MQLNFVCHFDIVMNTGYAESSRLLLFMCQFFDQRRPCDLPMSWLDCKHNVESAVSRTTLSIELWWVPANQYVPAIFNHYAYDILLSDCDRQHLWHPMICPHLAALPPNVAQQRQQRDHTCWCSNGETSHGQTNRRNTNPSQRTLSQRRRWLPRPK